MAGNSTLNKAKVAKMDEFYTCREDIEAELSHYKRFFEGKVVYCNCDDPTSSEFWRFFVRVFCDWKIKKLMATHYEPNEKNFAYKLELTEDTNGDGKIDWLDEPVITQIQCNGDFRSDICIEMLKEADIVVTNPPFSLIREYISQLVEYEKNFLIMAPLNAVKYREVFPLIKDNKVWSGFGFNKTMEFIMPDTYELKGKAYIDENGRKHGFVPGICWLTNLDIEKRHLPLDLRGNYYTSEKYIKLANYNAINVNKVNDIPCDYEGVMAVPISFLSSFNPDQFKLLGRTGELDWATSDECDFFTPPSEEICNKFKKQNNTWRVQNGYYVTDDGVAHTIYDRLFIIHKHPDERRYPNED